MGEQVICEQRLSIDAMGRQKDIADTMVASDADYTPTVKGNQSALYSDTIALFNRADKNANYLGGLSFCKTTSKGQCRVEADRTLSGKTT